GRRSPSEPHLSSLPDPWTIHAIGVLPRVDFVGGFERETDFVEAFEQGVALKRVDRKRRDFSRRRANQLAGEIDGKVTVARLFRQFFDDAFRQLDRQESVAKTIG